MLKCYLGRFSVRRRGVAPHYRLHWATKIRKIREINTFRHYFSPRGPKKCATAKWAQGRNATAMRAGGAGGRARDSDGRAHEPGRTHEPAGHTSRRAHDGGHTTEGTRRRAADRTEGWMGGPAARFSSRFSGRFSSRLSSRLSAQHAARATRTGRRPANRPQRPGAPHPAAGCAGWSGCRSGRPAPRTRRRCGRGGG